MMLERLQQLADKGDNFAFETTLASKTFAHWLKTLKVKDISNAAVWEQIRREYDGCSL